MTEQIDAIDDDKATICDEEVVVDTIQGGEYCVRTDNGRLPASSSDIDVYPGTIDDVVREVIRLRESKLPGVGFTIKWSASKKE